ncbi:tetratricopeptide repeat protein [Methylocystis sp. ATCC 49242]|uniref:tetratricopeptide repeat protein n=1 Tax=Methylocystis sp. ATCC 49242 TaxID=622637 RepID=UPI0001F88090|nr:tetratricopeptide repeat protein [Methylocystis sp. ATCC 49242]
MTIAQEISRVVAFIVAALWIFFGPACSALAQQTSATSPGSSHAGSETCAGCHPAESAAWKKSHHAAAMAPATTETVRGDFNNATAESHGSKGKFLRDGGRFVVETDGRDGKTARFEVSHTFGVEPLQQYLVTFPDGRLQALPWAWDTRPKDSGGQRWFHLYPDQATPSSDPLHWTRSMQNWNFMCAECHTSDLHKNYDAKKDRFRTSFSELGVGCEACHGGASGHVDWAKGARNPLAKNQGFAAAHARRPHIDWSPDEKTGSPAQSASRPIGDEVELCARCHSRRGQLTEDWRPGKPLEDTHAPALLTHDLFEDDGQMKDEVFNDHLFKQSLMYARGVNCSDCHDPHSGRLKAARADVCGQCHQAERFSSATHTGHKSGPGAPDCVSCHMPARTYMVVDERHDHSFRIPRPDLSVTLGTPNSCNACHKDRSASWAANAIEQWHGPVRKGYQHWAEAFHKARLGEPSARELLLKLANDASTPAVARATAISEAQRLPSMSVEQATNKALSDPDPIVRMAAVRALSPSLPLDQRWRRVEPLLSDPVRAIRIEAAVALADQPADTLSKEDASRLEAAWAEYEASQRLIADRPEGRANLGMFLLRRGKPAEAEAEYLAGLKLEPAAAPLSVNLADLYRGQGKEAESEQVLRKAIAISPDAAAGHHALGLSLVRQRRYDEAISELGRAVELAPDESRYAYVNIVALQSLGREQESRALLDKALRRFPYDMDILQLELQDAIQAEDVKRAAPVASTLAEMAPDDAEIARLAAELKDHR